MGGRQVHGPFPPGDRIRDGRLAIQERQREVVAPEAVPLPGGKALGLHRCRRRQRQWPGVLPTFASHQGGQPPAALALPTEMQDRPHQPHHSSIPLFLSNARINGSRAVDDPTPGPPRG